MLRVEARCFVDVTFEGFDGLVRQNFIKLLVQEDARGLIPPVFELELRQMDKSLYRYVVKKGLVISISYGSSVDKAETYEFSLLNHRYKADTDNGGFTLNLTGLLKLESFTNSPAISAIKGTSIDALESLTTITPDLDYIADDEQVWIRHNMSEKSFAEKIIEHAYISDKDLVVAALTVNGELVARSAKTALEEVAKVIFSERPLNTSPNTARFNDFDIESDNAIWSKFLSEGRTLNVVSLTEREDTLLIPETGSLFNGEQYSEFLENIPFAAVLDSGNTHDKYYQAWINNLAYAVGFLLNNVSIATGHRFFTNKDLRLLDTVEFIPNNPSNDSFVDAISGNYLVVTKTTVISQKGFKIGFLFGRDFNVQ